MCGEKSAVNHSWVCYVCYEAALCLQIDLPHRTGRTVLFKLAGCSRIKPVWQRSRQKRCTARRIRLHKKKHLRRQLGTLRSQEFGLKTQSGLISELQIHFLLRLKEPRKQRQPEAEKLHPDWIVSILPWKSMDYFCWDKLMRGGRSVLLSLSPSRSKSFQLAQQPFFFLSPRPTESCTNLSRSSKPHDK